VDYFKSSLDAVLLDTLWNKYWVNTLAASPLLATRALGTGQLTDIGARRAARRQGPADPGLGSGWRRGLPHADSLELQTRSQDCIALGCVCCQAGRWFVRCGEQVNMG